MKSLIGRQPISRLSKMRFAYAIAAYSVIEELDLNVKVNVSANRRSILENGDWNNEVLDDLNIRLTASGVNIDEHVSWMIRGEETNIERKRSIRLTKLAEWADKDDFDYSDSFSMKVKDGYVTVPDAINYISFLRSSISSHAVGKRIMDLSVFDVANAQHLARRLILERTGKWKYKLNTTLYKSCAGSFYQAFLQITLFIKLKGGVFTSICFMYYPCQKSLK